MTRESLDEQEFEKGTNDFALCLDRIFGSSSADVLVDKVVLIHGKPYRFIERLGAGSFGKRITSKHY